MIIWRLSMVRLRPSTIAHSSINLWMRLTTRMFITYIKVGVKYNGHEIREGPFRGCVLNLKSSALFLPWRLPDSLLALPSLDELCPCERFTLLWLAENPVLNGALCLELLGCAVVDCEFPWAEWWVPGTVVDVSPPCDICEEIGTLVWGLDDLCEWVRLELDSFDWLFAEPIDPT